MFEAVARCVVPAALRRRISVADRWYACTTRCSTARSSRKSCAAGCSRTIAPPPLPSTSAPASPSSPAWPSGRPRARPFPCHRGDSLARRSDADASSTASCRIRSFRARGPFRGTSGGRRGQNRYPHARPCRTPPRMAPIRDLSFLRSRRRDRDAPIGALSCAGRGTPATARDARRSGVGIERTSTNVGDPRAARPSTHEARRSTDTDARKGAGAGIQTLGRE